MMTVSIMSRPRWQRSTLKTSGMRMRDSAASSRRDGSHTTSWKDSVMLPGRPTGCAETQARPCPVSRSQRAASEAGWRSRTWPSTVQLSRGPICRASMSS